MSWCPVKTASGELLASKATEMKAEQNAAFVMEGWSGKGIVVSLFKSPCLRLHGASTVSLSAHSGHISSLYYHIISTVIFNQLFPNVTNGWIPEARIYAWR